jgi:hypothetical protein
MLYEYSYISGENKLPRIFVERKRDECSEDLRTLLDEEFRDVYK